MSNNVLASHAAFEKQSIRIGIITVILAILANFIPALYLWLVKGVMIDFDLVLTIWSLAIVTFGLSWVVQPITYYPMMGVAGSYIGWVCGSVADIRAPSATMAQKTAGVESGTPAGDVMSTIGVTGSVFMSVAIITVFTFIGAQIIPLLPPAVTKSFTYILPAVFGAVFADMASKNLKTGIGVLIVAFGLIYVIRAIGLPGAIGILAVVVAAMLVARIVFVTEKKK